MDTKVKAKVKVDIIKEALSMGVSVQRLLKQLYEEGNSEVGLYEEES